MQTIELRLQLPVVTKNNAFVYLVENTIRGNMLGVIDCLITLGIVNTIINKLQKF